MGFTWELGFGAWDFSIPFEHLIPLRFEFRSRFPLGKFISVRDLIADFEEQLYILDRSRKVPVGLYFVGYLVVVLQIKLVGAQRCVLRT